MTTTLPKKNNIPPIGELVDTIVTDCLNTVDVKSITINECSAQFACLLNGIWHSRLPKIEWSNVVRNTHYVCFVFMYKQSIIGCGIWSSPVAQNRMKNGKSILELRRLALSDVCPKNTATRVISSMIKQISKKFDDIVKLISYQDKEVHLGTIYKAANWYVGAETELIDWNTSSRKRNVLQSTSAKIRWEFDLPKRTINVDKLKKLPEWLC